MTEYNYWYTIMNYEKAVALLEQYLRTNYSIGIDDVEITETKGYWRLKKHCDDSCHHPIHGCLGNEGRIRHTISFTPSRREKGKFVSCYEVWNTITNNGER